MSSLAHVLPSSIAREVASFMEFAPGVPDSDVVINDLMLMIRKKFLDLLAFQANGVYIRVGERYMLELTVEAANEDEDDRDYSLENKELHGYLLQLKEGFQTTEATFGHWSIIDDRVLRPATPTGFRELRLQLLKLVERAETNGLCPTAPGRPFCDQSCQTVRFVCAPRSRYCVHCCLHLAFRGSPDVQ